jgi:hypothetical protein
MKLLAALACCAAFAASAAEVAGVRLEDRINVVNTDLVLNGAGLRKRAIFQVYVIGLYVPQKNTAAAALIEQPGAKRVAITMLRDVGADTFTEALVEGIRANHTEAEAKALEPRMRELAATIAGLKEATKGMSILLDWRPASGTVLVANGSPRGSPIAGEDFYRALLRIWLGDKPVQDDLKKALLGS